MRSSRPIPGEAWPHDMMLTIDDRSQALLALLWLREAHGLRPHGDDLPPLLADTPASVHDPSITAEMRTAWEDSWAPLWHALIAHAGRDFDNQKFAAIIQDTANGSPERIELLREWAGPSWHDQFGELAFASPLYDRWEWEGFEAHAASRPESLNESPERRDLTELIAAWNRGLVKVVTIPCRGDFSRKISATALLTTDAIRADSASYRRALLNFS